MIKQIWKLCVTQKNEIEEEGTDLFYRRKFLFYS